MNVATLTAKMVMDVSGFSSGANKAIGTVNSLKSGIGSLSASMVAGAAGGLAMAGAMSALRSAASGVQGVLHTLANEVQHGFGLAMAAESAQTQFKVLLGSAEKAKTLMEEINSFAQATPFSVTGARESVQKLLGAGVSEDRLMSTMRMLGEISGGSTEKLGLMAHTYGEVMAKGKLLASELNQLSSAGINAREALAGELHIEVKDLAKAMEAGKVTAIDFHNALHELATGKFAGSLEEGAKTMEGSLNRLKEVRDSLGREVALDLSKKWGITETANDLANFAEGLKVKIVPEVVNAFDKMADAAFAFVDNLRGIHLLTPIGQMEAIIENPTANPFTRLRDDLANINTRRDFADALRGVRDAGAAANANAPPLPESKRMEKSAFTDLGKSMGSAIAMDFGKAFAGVGSRFGGMAMEGARGGLRSFLTPEVRPEQKPTGALAVGSSEAFSAIIAAMTGRDRNTDTKRTAAATEEAVKMLDKAVGFLERIAREAGGDVVNAFSG